MKCHFCLNPATSVCTFKQPDPRIVFPGEIQELDLVRDDVSLIYRPKIIEAKSALTDSLSAIDAAISVLSQIPTVEQTTSDGSHDPTEAKTK